MPPEDKPRPINDAGASTADLGERLAIRLMIAGIVSYQAATASAEGSMPAAAIVAEMKRIIATAIEAMDLQVKSAADATDPLVIEEEIRSAALGYLEATFAFVRV